MSTILLCYIFTASYKFSIVKQRQSIDTVFVRPVDALAIDLFSFFVEKCYQHFPIFGLVLDSEPATMHPGHFSMHKDQFRVLSSDLELVGSTSNFSMRPQPHFKILCGPARIQKASCPIT